MLNKLKQYLTSRPELDVLLFKILGLGGISICLISDIYSLCFHDFISVGINTAAALVSALLLYLVEKTGKYTVGYVLTEIGVFGVLFTMLFLTSGGLDGSMPFFFAFALIFTFLMFRGRLLVFMVSTMSIYYALVLTYTFYHPEIVVTQLHGIMKLTEKLTGVFFSALSLGFIFLQYIKAYQKQKKMAEDANSAKSLFLANMSHEIRTPINSILGFNEIILTSSTDKSIQEYAGYVDEAGHHLLEVINEILDFSKLDSGKESLLFEAYSLKDLSASLRSLMDISAKQKNLNYTIEYDRNLEELVVGDEEKLHRILVNLLSNAFKYTHKGTVVLSIQLLEKTSEYQKVHFAVSDTGIGIKKEDMEHLFRSYERADLLKNQHIQGTGLGLAISSQLVQLMGGAIRVESTYGEGSTFSFELRLPLGHLEASGKQSTSKQMSYLAPNASILVVDDNAMNRILVETYLQKLQIHVNQAENGMQCLEMVEQKEYDLILMDYMMPEMDGAETMEAIRKKEASLGKYTPILVLTADIVDHIDSQLLQRGFDAYISKPIDFTTLIETMRGFLPKSKILPQESDLSAELPTEELDTYNSLLTPYDVNIYEGIKYVNYDLPQYLRILEFFVKNSPSSMDRLHEALEDGNLDSLRLSFHSLKGTSGNVGATQLHKLAKQLEEKAKQPDMEYIECAADLLFLHWNRVLSGLNMLLDMQSAAEEVSEKNMELYGFEDLLEELRRELNLCQMRNALKILGELKKYAKDDATSEKLHAMDVLVSEMEFDQALEIMNKWGES